MQHFDHKENNRSKAAFESQQIAIFGKSIINAARAIKNMSWKQIPTRFVKAFMGEPAREDLSIGTMKLGAGVVTLGAVTAGAGLIGANIAIVIIGGGIVATGGAMIVLGFLSKVIGALCDAIQEEYIETRKTSSADNTSKVSDALLHCEHPESLVDNEYLNKFRAREMNLKTQWKHSTILQNEHLQSLLKDILFTLTNSLQMFKKVLDAVADAQEVIAKSSCFEKSSFSYQLENFLQLSQEINSNQLNDRTKALINMLTYCFRT